MPKCKMASYLYTVSAHPPVYFRSSLHHFKYLVLCECYVNSCLTSCVFWNFFPQCFNPCLGEFAGMECADMEGQLRFVRNE